MESKLSGPAEAERPKDVPEGDHSLGRQGHRFVASVSSGVGNAIATALLGVIAVRLNTVHFHPAGYGMFVTAITVASSVMLLTDLGVSGLAGREMSKRPEDARAIISQNLGLRLTLSSIVLPPIVLLAYFIYGSKSMTLVWLILVVSLAIPFDAVRTISLSYYVSKIRNYYSAPIVLTQLTVYLLGVIVTITLHRSILGIGISYFISTVISAGLALSLVRREVAVRPQFDRRQWRIILKQSILLGAIQVINMFYLKADTLLLSVMKSSRAVGMYGVAYAFVTFFSVIPTVILTGLIPAMTRSSLTELAKLVQRASNALATIGVLIAVGTIFLAPSAVNVLAGHRFLPASTALRLLAVSLVATFPANAFGYAATMQGRNRRMIWISIGALVLNVVLNIILIPLKGIDGSAFATLVSESIALVAIYEIYRLDLGGPVSLVTAISKPIGAGVITAAVAFAIVPSNSTSPFALLASGSLITLVYVGALVVLRGIPEDIGVVGRRVVTRLTFRKRS